MIHSPYLHKNPGWARLKQSSKLGLELSGTRWGFKSLSRGLWCLRTHARWQEADWEVEEPGLEPGTRMRGAGVLRVS